MNITFSPGDISSVKELKALKDSLYSTLANLTKEELKSFLTKAFENDIFIETHYLSLKIMSSHKSDWKEEGATYYNMCRLAFEIAEMGYVEQSWEIIRFDPNRDVIHYFLKKFFEKGNAEKTGDFLTHLDDFWKIVFIEILLDPTSNEYKLADEWGKPLALRIAASRPFEINFTDEEVKSLALRAAASLPEDYKNKWSKIIMHHFDPWNNESEGFDDKEKFDDKDKKEKSKSTCILS